MINNLQPVDLKQFDKMSTHEIRRAHVVMGLLTHSYVNALYVNIIYIINLFFSNQDKTEYLFKLPVHFTEPAKY